MVETLAIDKSLEIINTYFWLYFGLLGFFECLTSFKKIQNQNLFLRALNKLNVVLAELVYKISKINLIENRVRFTWCPAHVGIQRKD